MTPIILRQDQWQMKCDTYSEWNNGARVVLNVLPTGGGKSIIISDIVNDKFMLGAQQAVIAHRNELVSQMSMHIARRGIKHRIIGSKSTVSGIINEHREEFGRSLVNPDAYTAVVGIDTLNARANELAGWAAQIDFFHGDEGHHFLAGNKWGKGVNMFTRARGTLWTASPSRADRKGLGRHADGIADAMVLGPDMRSLINIGALTDYEIVCPTSDIELTDDDIGASGDYSPVKLAAAAEKSHIVGDVVTEYVKYAIGKRAICFATDVKTAGEISKRFNDVGIPAAAVSANTPEAVRRNFIKRFKLGQIWVLVNVDLFGEGFDVPACEVVIMARPTASLGVYLQQFGRAMRTMPGKLYGLIIDHVGNVKRHGFPDKPHYWTMDRLDKRAKREKSPDEIENAVCTNCSRPYLRALPKCPHCGFAPELPVGGARSIEVVDGDLTLLNRDMLAEMRKTIILESPASVANRVGFATGVNNFGSRAADNQIETIQTQQRLAAAIDQWAGIGKARGQSDGEMYRRFYLTVGMDVYSAQTLKKAEMEALAQRVEGWFQ